MAEYSDVITMQKLTVQAAGTVNGNWVDLSGYRTGAFYVIVSAFVGSIAPSFQMSPDNGNTIIAGGIPVTEVASPGALAAVASTRYPFLSANPGPTSIEWPWVRVSSVITTGPVSATILFIGKV